MQVKFYATLRDLVSAKDVSVPAESGATVRAVLADLAARYPAFERKLWDHGRLNGQITVLLNGRSIDYLAGLDTPVQPGDTLALFPPIGGG